MTDNDYLVYESILYRRLNKVGYVQFYKKTEHSPAFNLVDLVEQDKTYGF